MFEIISIKDSKASSSICMFGVLSYMEDDKNVTVNIAKDTESVILLDKDDVTSLKGAGAGALIGGMLLGPVGMLAGCFLGSKSKEVLARIKFKDRKEMLVRLDNKTYKKLESAASVHSL